MTKMNKLIKNLAGYLGIGLLSYSVGQAIGSQTVVPLMTKSAASYIKNYAGERPQDAIDYTLTTLKNLEELSTSHWVVPNSDVMNSLESKLTTIKTSLGENSPREVYGPVLKDVSKDIAATSNASLEKALLGLAIGAGCLGYASKEE